MSADPERCEDGPVTPVEFLTARLDEEAARVDAIPDWYCTNSARGDGWGSRGDCPLCGHYMFDGTEAVTEEAYWEHMEKVHRRTYVLADIAAKRAVIAWAVERVAQSDATDIRGGWPDMGPRHAAEAVLELLVQPFADHPDFDPAWLV